MSKADRFSLLPYIRMLASAGAERRELAGLLLLMLFGACLEATGIGAVLPFIGAIQDPSGMERGVLGAFLGRIGATTLFAKIAVLGGGLAVLFVTKNAYAVYVNALQIRFIYARMVVMARGLLRDYLEKPYTFHLDTNSAEIARSVISDSTLIFLAAVPSTFVIVVEGTTLLVVGAVLVALEPVAIPIAGCVMAGVVWVLQRTVVARLASLGARARDHQGSMLMWVNQALGGIKEIKVRGSQEYFIGRFSDDLKSHAEALASYRIAATWPRSLLEALGVVGLVMVTLLLLARHDNPATVIPTLGALAVAVVRVLPATARIVGSMTDIRYYQSAAIALSQHSPRAAPEVSVPSRAMDLQAHGGQLGRLNTSLSFHNVTYAYPNAESPAVREFEFTIRQGETVAVIGSSGAGKTTIADLAVGLLTPDSGHLEVDGVPLDDDSIPRWRETVSYIPQHVYLCDDTVRRNIAFAVNDDEIDQRRMDVAIKLASLTEFVSTLPQGLDTVVGEGGARLSGGQRQRIGIARALYREPSFLVFDEATSALDGITERDIAQAIETLRGQRTMLIIAHRLASVRTCDRIVLMERGRVVDVGPWSELIQRSSEFRALVEAAAT